MKFEKERTRAAILAGAGRTFRSLGFEGSGVEWACQSSAGVTSGAF